jgi:CSLREA domain-containing protein
MPSLTRLAASLALVLGLATAAPAAAGAAAFTVDTTADAYDDVPGDGGCATADAACSLRAALDEAAALAEPTTVTLPAGTYVVTEDALPTVGDVTLTGAGAATTTIDGNDFQGLLRFDHGTNAVTGVTVRRAGLGLPGIRQDGGTLAVSAVIVSENTKGSNLGAGILKTNGTLTVADSLVTANATASGGPGAGIYNGPGALTVTRTTISANRVPNSSAAGGGIASVGSSIQDATLTVTDSTVSGNRAGEGGGIFALGTATITNTTIAGNVTATTPGQGSGVAVGRGVQSGAPPGLAILDHVTLAGNGGLSSIHVRTGGGIRFRNSAFGADTFGRLCNAGFTPQFEGVNLFEDTTCLLEDPEREGIDLDLQPLADYGGPTQTIAPRPGSPVVDAAEGCPAPATDQRGVARPDGAACDVGAFEGTVEDPPDDPDPDPDPETDGGGGGTTTTPDPVVIREEIPVPGPERQVVIRPDVVPSSALAVRLRRRADGGLGVTVLTSSAGRLHVTLRRGSGRNAVTVGRGSATAAAGGATEVRVRLTRAARRALRAGRLRRVRVLLEFTPGAGTRTGVGTLTLKENR